MPLQILVCSPQTFHRAVRHVFQFPPFPAPPPDFAACNVITYDILCADTRVSGDDLNSWQEGQGSSPEDSGSLLIHRPGQPGQQQQKLPVCSAMFTLLVSPASPGSCQHYWGLRALTRAPVHSELD
ncbi:arylacetamide deacetylase-like 3 [Platysternon megacephalum]|uniref:Arylacetamide deacetylase-like 3 n=1 Tax=Platysternon megacephalum TaxID=55544 RepID=A0A4D9F3Y8_9SAUR|nr:arylacetamide deacetylase-like 3 [Platysternon megacephalum]